MVIKGVPSLIFDRLHYRICEISKSRIQLTSAPNLTCHGRKKQGVNLTKILRFSSNFSLSIQARKLKIDLSDSKINSSRASGQALRYSPVADLHGPIYFISTQFSVNFGQIIGWHPLSLSGWHTTLGNPGFAAVHRKREKGFDTLFISGHKAEVLFVPVDRLVFSLQC